MSKYVKVEDVMSFINTSNRGNSDYFIVDQIEDLCKNKGKTFEELKKEQNTQKCSKKVVARYSYEHNDGDQIWEDRTTYYQLANGTFQKEYYEGYYGKTSTFSPVTYNEIVEKMDHIEKEVKRRKEAIEMYGSHHPFSRGGYTIDVPLQKKEGVYSTDIDVEFVFKKNLVEHCYYSYYKKTDSTSVVVTFQNKENTEEQKKNITAFLNSHEITNIHFEDSISRQVDMDWNLLYSSRLGLLDKDFFESKNKDNDMEEEIER